MEQAERADKLLALGREQRLQAVGAKMMRTLTPLSVKLIRLPEDYSGVMTGVGCSEVSKGVVAGEKVAALPGPLDVVEPRTSKKKSHKIHRLPLSAYGSEYKRVHSKSKKSRKRTAHHLRNEEQNSGPKPAVHRQQQDLENDSSSKKSRQHKVHWLDNGQNGTQKTATVGHRPKSPENNSALAIPLQSVKSSSSATTSSVPSTLPAVSCTAVPSGQCNNGVMFTGSVVQHPDDAGKSVNGNLSLGKKRDGSDNARALLVLEQNEYESTVTTTSTATAAKSLVSDSTRFVTSPDSVGAKQQAESVIADSGAGGGNDVVCHAAAAAAASSSESFHHSSATSSWQDVASVRRGTRGCRGRPRGRRGRGGHRADSGLPVNTEFLDNNVVDRGVGPGYRGRHWGNCTVSPQSYYGASYDTDIDGTTNTGFSHQFSAAPGMHHSPYAAGPLGELKSSLLARFYLNFFAPYTASK